MFTRIFLLPIAAALQGSPKEDPGAVVQLAITAVEDDSAAVWQERWTLRLERDPDDRLAALGLATLARLTYDFDLADSLYARILAGAPDDRVSAHARLEHALGLLTRGFFARADTALQQAAFTAEATDDSSAWAEALLELAGLWALTRGSRAADSAFSLAALLIEPKDLRLRAEYHCLRAYTMTLVSQPEAVSEAAAGADLAARAGSRRTRARCLYLQAAALASRGDAAAIVGLQDEAVAEYRRARHDAGLAAALVLRGQRHFRFGALGHARRDLLEAISAGEVSGNHTAVSRAFVMLGFLSLDLGDVASAKEFIERSSALLDPVDRFAPYTLDRLRGDIARETGRLEDARRAYFDALSRIEELDWAPGVIYTRMSLAHLAIHQRDWAAAERELSLARREARDHALLEDDEELEYHFGALALQRGDLDEAERIFRRALARLTGSREDWRYYHGARLGEVHARRGKLVEAAATLLSATDALESWRAGLQGRQLRLLAFEHAEDLSDPDMGVAFVVSALAAGPHLETAFEIAERRRARELADRLLRAEVVRAGGDADSLPESLAPTAPRATLADVAAGLPDERTALLEFVTGEGNEPTTLFVVTRAGASAHILPPEDSVAPLVTRLITLLESGADAAGLGRALGTALLDSALAALPSEISRLVISPNGRLHRVPFDYLILANGEHLVERFAIGLTPSATLAVQLWARPPSAPESRLLAFGDPAFAREVEAPSAATEDLFRAAFAAEGSLPRLAASGREARGIARYAADATVLRRDEATEARLKREVLERYSVVHFATHALVDEASLARTALVLAPGEGEDGLIVPGELAALHLAAELVVLSACQSARGTVVRGEGMQGLTAPLLEAGARAIVATQWRIGDRATATFVQRFYRRLAEGMNVGDALRAAKLEALAAGARPAEWAAFTLVGDPLARPDLRVPASPFDIQWAVALAALAIAAGLAYGLRIRKGRARDRI